MSPILISELTLTSDSCYTNHALDQFLEHLVSDGVNQIIRIGGRCKSSVLQPLNLVAIASKMEETKSEKSSVWKFRTRLEHDGKEVSNSFRRLRRASTLESILDYLEAEYPEHGDQHLNSKDEERYQVVHHQHHGPLR